MEDNLTTLVKPKIFESKRVIVTSQMLHIGSSVSELANFEFVQANERIYLPNLDALARAFKEAKSKALLRPDPFARPKLGQKQNTRQQTNELLNEFLEVIKSRNQDSFG
ncbi:MAG: hypothetical protein HC916_12880 [Coleofasciculaceae cyanobacterium SM2_1_6]|nr:hypothetical protein [Coleofasciculaceae cyanobacterium SM2_1_6]